MIQMMMATVGGPAVTRGTRQQQPQQQRAFMLRKAAGFAIVAGGFAVIVAQALQHAFGG